MFQLINLAIYAACSLSLHSYIWKHLQFAVCYAFSWTPVMIIPSMPVRVFISAPRRTGQWVLSGVDSCASYATVVPQQILVSLCRNW